MNNSITSLKSNMPAGCGDFLNPIIRISIIILNAIEQSSCSLDTTVFKNSQTP